jgi:predicted Zn-dependent protease
MGHHAGSLLRGLGCHNVTPMTDWYRTPDWDETARADFEQHLARARSSRSEYLRIKGLALQGAGMLDEARGLYERVLAEHPGDFFEVWILELLADLARSQGRLEEAERRYRGVLAHPDANMRGSGMVEVSLAEVLMERGMPEDAANMLQTATENESTMDSVTGMYANFFRFHLVRARCATRLGDTETAADAAQLALSVVDAPDQYSRHPGVGAVHADEHTLRELRSLVP